MLHLDKILSDLTKLQRSRDKKSASPLGSPIFCQAILLHFLVSLVSQNPSAPSNAHTGMVSCRALIRSAVKRAGPSKEV